VAGTLIVGFEDAGDLADDRSGTGDIERTLQLLWDPEATSGRGPRRSLRVATIIDSAVAIADADGSDAVSIRSVAAASVRSSTASRRASPHADGILRPARPQPVGAFSGTNWLAMKVAP
jgi:hypothetical protein